MVENLEDKLTLFATNCIATGSCSVMAINLLSQQKYVEATICGALAIGNIISGHYQGKKISNYINRN